MRIFNKMKKTMLVLAASLFCANVAFADTQTVYSWESPEGTPAETGGTMVYTNGDGERLNYSNADYHTICLNGKFGNIGDAEASTNAGHMVLTLDEALQTGDVISITAYRNKNADGKNASIYFLFENGAEWKDANSFVNICADDADEDYDDDGATPNTVTWTITDAEAGSKTIKLTRNSASTNLFITKMTITREVADAPVVESTPLTADMFKAWDSPTAPTTSSAVACSFVLNESTGLPYGDGNVGYLNYADLSEYSKLVVTVSEGTPRFCFNRLTADGQDTQDGVDSKLLDIPGKPWGTEKYQTVEGNVYTIDLEKIVADYGYAHLNCIKGANWVNVTVVSMMLVKDASTPATKVAYLCGLTETTEAIYTALVNAGLDVTPLNYDAITLNDSIVDTDFAGKYDLVVLAGNTGSGTNLAKAFNLLLGKVNVLSTKAFWYAKTSPAGTNGGNPGTADAPSLNMVKSIADHPIFAGIAGDEFAVFNDMAKSNGRYLQSNGKFANDTPAQTVVAANANGTDCIGEAWVDGMGWIIIPVDGIQPEGYLTADGEALFVNAAKYLIAGEQYVAPSYRFDHSALDAAIAAAEAYKATLNPEDETEAMAIEAVDEYVASATAWMEEIEADPEATQADADFVGEDLSATIEGLKSMVESQKLMTKVQEAEAAGQELLAKYPNYTDEAGLVDALRNLPRFAMGMTAEQIQAAIDAVYAAIALFEEENKPFESGDYYLKNVASGKYLVGGNSWGTFATLGDHAEDVGLAMLEDGKYTIDTRLSNGGENHYLGGAGWMDGAATGWTFAKQAKGIYALTVDDVNYLGWDGANSAAAVALTDPTSPNAQWQLITKDELVAGLAEATAVQPVDATFFIQDPNFGRNNTRVSAWVGDPVKGGDVTNFCAEKWNANFDIYQDLAGLPNGYYKVSVQGYYRAGNGGATSMEQNAYLYAGEKSTPLMNINAEAGNAVFEGGNVSTVEGMGIVPNNMATASTAFTAGLYANNKLMVQVTDGTLRIGVKKETLIDADWTIFDNFQLTYYGTEEPPVIAPGTYYMKNVGADKFLVAANSWGTQASFGAHGIDVQVAFANGKYTIDTNISNGGDNHFLGSNGYVDSPAAEWTLVEQANGTFALTADGASYIGYDGSTSVLSITLTDAASANAQWQFISQAEMVEALADASISNPVDATFFIQDPNFGRNDGRFSAWQGSPVKGGDNANMNAEKWNTNFDIYQDLAGLPNGYYKLSAQGYYRAGNGGATAMDQNAYLYAGEVSTPLMNINAHAGDPVISGNTSDVPGLGLVPNNMATASTAFSAGLYADNNLMVQVTDGTLRIGVKKDVLIAADWTIFDNFELYYLGNIDPALLAAVDSLNALIAEAEAWKAELNAEDEMHAMVLGTLDMMIPAAQAVADAPTSVEQVNGMIFDVYSMLGTYKPMVEKYDAGMAATAAAEEAQALYGSFNNPSDDAGLAAAIANVQEGVALLNDWFEPITIEELNARVAAMRVAQKAFIYENPNKPVASYAAIQAENRVVALTHELEGLTIYYKTAEAADYMIYTAPFHISDNTSVWAYAEYVSPEGKAYASDVLEAVVAAGTEIALAEPVIDAVGDTEFTCTVTSDQSDIINNYGITPKETITYDFFPWIEAKGECAKVPSKSGVLTSGESVNGLEAGLLIVKVAAYGFESAETVKYLGAAENWAGGDAFVTGIDEVNAKEVKEVKYYTTSGAQIEEPTSGIYIQRVIFTDGTVKTTTVAGK